MISRLCSHGTARIFNRSQIGPVPCERCLIEQNNRAALEVCVLVHLLLALCQQQNEIKKSKSWHSTRNLFLLLLWFSLCIFAAFLSFKVTSPTFLTQSLLFLSVLSIILRSKSPYDLMDRPNIKDTIEALIPYSGMLQKQKKQTKREVIIALIWTI